MLFKIIFTIYSIVRKLFTTVGMQEYRKEIHFISLFILKNVWSCPK